MAGAWRTIRVFVSSTFRDMHAERDFLVRFVFPKLREKLAAHRVNLIEYDLRWGVTADDDALTVCRDIIDECRPRFICLLGGRYGWIPDGLDRSITADEIYYAAVENQRLEHQFFYFRDPKVTAEMDEKDPGEFREPVGSPSEKMLDELKKKIEHEGFVPFTYKAKWDGDSQRLLELEEFCERVYQDLLTSIAAELDLDAGEEIGPFDEENALMESFAQVRTQRYVLGSRDVVLDQIVNFSTAEPDSRGLVVTGPSGNGKSALLAVVDQFLRNDSSDVLSLLHFVGASPQSVTVRGMLRRLCHELGKSIGIETELPDDTEQLVDQFQSLLSSASRDRRVVLLLDALNQLSPEDNAHQLNWLPAVIPANVRIVISSNTHKVAQSLEQRGDFQFIELQPLKSSDAELIIKQFLGRYGKQVDRIQLELLLEKEESGSPLYLLIALEELRTLGQYELMTSMIRELPGTTRDLLVWLFDVRLSGDPGFRDENGNQIGAKLVKRFASFIGISRSGLSSQELVSLIDPGDPRGNVAALERFLSPYCMRRGDLVDFQHQRFNDVVDELYLLDPEFNAELHGELASLFHKAADPRGDQSWVCEKHRVFRELPYHLAKADRLDDLHALIKQDFFKRYTHLLGNGEGLAVTKGIAELFVRAMPREKVVDIAYAYCEIAQRTSDIASRLETVIRAGDVDSAAALIEAEPSIARKALMRVAAIEFLRDSGQSDVANQWIDKREQFNQEAYTRAQIRISDSLAQSQAERGNLLLRPLYPPVDQPWQTVEESELENVVEGQNNFSFGFRFWLYGFSVLGIWGVALFAMLVYADNLFSTWDETDTVTRTYFGGWLQLVMWSWIFGLVAIWVIGRPFLRKNLSREISRLCIGALHSDYDSRRRACRFISRLYHLLLDYNNKKWQAEPSLQDANPFIRCLVTRTARECATGTEFAKFVVDVSVKQLQPIVVDDLIVELRNRDSEFQQEFKQQILESGYRNNDLFVLQLMIDTTGPAIDPEVLAKLVEHIFDKKDLEQLPLELSKVSRVSLARALVSTLSDSRKNTQSINNVISNFRGETKAFWKQIKRNLALPFRERVAWILLYAVPLVIGLSLGWLMLPLLFALLVPFVLLVRVRDANDLLQLDVYLENAWVHFTSVDERMHSQFAQPHYHELIQFRKRTFITSGLIALLVEKDLPAVQGPAYEDARVVRDALRRVCRPDFLGNSNELVLRIMGQRDLLDEFAASHPKEDTGKSEDAEEGIVWDDQIRNVLPIKSPWWHFATTLAASWLSIAIWVTLLCLLSQANVTDYFVQRGGYLLAVWSSILVLSQIVYRRQHTRRVILVILIAVYMLPGFFGVHEAGITRWEFYLALIPIFSTHWVAPVFIARMRGTNLLFPNRTDFRRARIRAIAEFLFWSVLLGLGLKFFVWLSYSPFWLF